MNRPLHILQICPRIPYPPNDGGKIGIFNITKYVAMKGHQITMLTFSDDSEVPHEMKEFATIVTVKHDTRTKVIGVAKNLFSKLPYTVSKYQSEKMIDALRNLCREHLFDVVHVDHAHFAPYGIIAKNEFGIPYCLREHNFETTIYERYGETQRFNLLKMYMKMQALRIRCFEKSQLANVDVCMAITQEDANKIREEVDVPLRIIPAGVDLEKHKVLNRANEKPNSILILGSLAWQPNNDAAEWFITEIFPLIQKQIPSVTVTIVGMSPTKALLSKKSEHIHIPGFVDDIQSLIASTQVLAIPLRIGSGMRIKMLEYFAHGKAVVSTTVGAEGNHAAENIHYIRADTPEEFCAAIITLFKTEEKRRNLGDTARIFVEENYSWNSIADQFIDAYHTAIASKKK